MPIDVGADIQKCESIGSIIEHLNKGPRFFAISVSDLYQQPSTSQVEGVNGPYMLHPPPLTSDLTSRDNCDLTREELTITCALNGAGNNTPASMGNHNHQSTSPCQHGGYMHESIYTANETFVGTDITTAISSSALCGEDNSEPVMEDSVPVKGDGVAVSSISGGYVQEQHVTPHANKTVTKSESSTKDVVEDNNSLLEEYDIPECPHIELNKNTHISTAEEIDGSDDDTSSDDSDSHVVLTFPPSNTNNGGADVIGFEPGYLPGAVNTCTTTEESLTSMNLKINPHHFHPLEHFAWHQH